MATDGTATPSANNEIFMMCARGRRLGEEREHVTTRGLAAGYSNREIAKACFVAEGTVKNHISNILSKLGVRDRTRAVLRALHLGLI